MRSRRGNLRLRGALLLCALSGALLALAFPRPGWWPLVWIALVPWMVAVRLATGWGAVLGSWLGGFVFLGILLYWLGLFGISVWFVASLAFSIPLLAWGLGVRWMGKLAPPARIIGAAVLWTGLEWARGLGMFGFTWGWLGYSQSPALWLLPVARVAGTIGISFLIVLVNAAIAEVVVRSGEQATGRRIVRLAAVIVFVALAMSGARAWVARQGGPGGAPVIVSVIQGSATGPLRAQDVNTPLTAAEMAKTREIYRSLTAEAARARPVLVVWPESVLPNDPDSDPTVSEWVAGSARLAHAWLLAGGPYVDKRGRQFNSAYLYAASGNQVARYDKVQLVPFGEYVPWRGRLPSLKRYHVRETDFASGGVHRVLQAGIIALGPMICFESIFPRISWDLTRRGAQVLVVMTNDAWFGRTAAAAQHRQIAVLRAVETNRWVVRAASAGISSIISPDGKIVDQAGLFERKVLSHEIRLGQSGAHPRPDGPIFAWLMVFLSIGFLIAPAALPHHGKRPRAKPAAPRSGPGAPRRSAPR
ncbi:MAG: apolipoprotein N-acyltransferase [Armatimonadota bacterium]